MIKTALIFVTTFVVTSSTVQLTPYNVAPFVITSVVVSICFYLSAQCLKEDAQQDADESSHDPHPFL